MDIIATTEGDLFVMSVGGYFRDLFIDGKSVKYEFDYMISKVGKEEKAVSDSRRSEDGQLQNLGQKKR